MPLFETNTNRYCTRAPRNRTDTPHLPVDLPWPVPRVLTQAYMDANYGPERCAARAGEVPWKRTSGDADNIAAEAGELPTALHDFRMDAFGRASYLFDTYPTDTTPMFGLKDLYAEWGSGCTPRWGASPPCHVSRNGECPKNTACLAMREGGDEGLCFSIEAFRKDGARMPCFTTRHCPDGFVCLADGGCAPLRVHVQNPAAADIGTLEFGVLADDCGFERQEHPYTQSTRGASPWEQVA